MNTSPETAEICAALSAAQAIMRPAELDATNPFLKNRYASLGAIISVIRDAFSKHGLAFVQDVSSGGGNVMVFTRLIHKSGQYIEGGMAISLPADAERGKSFVQTVSSNITYLKRIHLAAMCGVYGGDDDDGNQPEPKQQPRPQPQAMKVDASKTLVQNAQATGGVVTMTIEQAAAFTTRNGKAYGELAPEDLDAQKQKLLAALPTLKLEQVNEANDRLRALDLLISQHVPPEPEFPAEGM